MVTIHKGKLGQQIPAHQSCAAIDIECDPKTAEIYLRFEAYIQEYMRRRGKP
jgi:hypothetical protein